MQKVVQFFRHHWLLILILLVASFMRLYKIADYLTFLGDEGRDALVVYNILHGHLTLLGPTASVGGFFLGPIYYYIIAPGMLLAGFSPTGMAVEIALFGILTVWLVYVVGKYMFNKAAGLIAAGLYAISPLVILYSRSSWNPNLMPFTTLVMLFTLYFAVVKKNIWLYLVVGILYGIAMQLHYIEVFVGPVIAVYVLLGTLLYGKKKVQEIVMYELTIFAGFILGWSPFLAFEVRHGYNNLRAIFNFVFHPEDHGQGVGLANFLPTVENVFFRMFARLVLNIPDTGLYKLYSPMVIALWNISSWVTGIVSSLFIIIKLIQERANKEKVLQYSLLILWLGCGILFFGFYRKNIYDYYFEFMYPVPFLLVGGLLSFVWEKKWIGKGVSIGILIALILINIQGIPFRYPGNRQLLQTETISREVYNEAGNQPFNLALITGGNSDYAYRFFLTVWGNPPIVIQYPGIDPKRTSVTKQLIVICETVPCQPEGNPLWEIAGFGRAQIVSKKHVSVVDVYKLVHYNGK